MENRKPMLMVPEQIEHLKNKGITFRHVSEAEAADYLEYNNNYFKLASYRKNYDKYTSGEKAGQYVNLDFGYLRDLAIIDMSLRYVGIQMSLNIEHHVKLDILRMALSHSEDGYRLVSDFLDSMDPQQQSFLNNELSRNKESVYCADAYNKYHGDMPIWVFVELIPFGRLVALYGFIARRYGDRRMVNLHFLLKSCKKIRNACAHSSCILNDMRPGIAPDVPGILANELSRIKGLSKSTRLQRMKNIRMQHLISLFHSHKLIVTSSGVHRKMSEQLRLFDDRMMRNIDYYSKKRFNKIQFLFPG